MIEQHARDINFVAPHTPSACVALLESFVDNPVDPLVNTRIEIQEFRNGSYHFSILRSYYRLPTHRKPGRGRGYRRSNYVKVKAEGYLTPWADSNSCIVVGDTQILPKTYIVNGIFLMSFALLMLLLTTAFLSDFLFAAPIVLGVVFSFAHMTLIQPETLGNQYKTALLRQMKHALSAQSKPRKLQQSDLLALTDQISVAS